MKPWFFIVCNLFITVSLQGQGGGLLCSEAKYNEIPLLPSYTGVKYNEVPLKVSLRNYCPVAGDQNQMGACVGWALGYGALTIMRAQEAAITDRKEITEMANSAAYIYNQIKVKDGDCTSGAYIEDGLELLKMKGDCLEQSFNFSEKDCSDLPESGLSKEAMLYKIVDYATIFRGDEVSKSKIAKICKVLATRTPIVAGMAVTPDFWEIKPGQELWAPNPQTQPSGYHAMVLIGYDNLEKKFELLNSFGASWGKNGFIKIGYEDFSRLCRYAYVLIPEFNNEEPANDSTFSSKSEKSYLKGEFVFRKPVGYLSLENGDEVPFFEEVSTKWDLEEQIYGTMKGGFSVGDVFQLVAREIPKGLYVYVFSRNNNQKVNLHFPKPEEKTAGFILEKTVEIVIPNEASVLQLSEPGADYLCILYSKGIIKNFETRIDLLTQTDEPLPVALKKIFGDVLIPEHQIQYSQHKMLFSAFQVNGRSENVVPIILKVVAE